MSEFAYLRHHKTFVWHLARRDDPADINFSTWCGFQLSSMETSHCGLQHPRLGWISCLPVKRIEEAGWPLCESCIENKEMKKHPNLRVVKEG